MTDPKYLVDFVSKKVEITVDFPSLLEIVKDTKNLVINPAGAEAFEKIYRLKQAVDEAYDIAREFIVEEAQKVDPNFKMIRSERLSLSYSAAGGQSKYAIDESKINELSDELYTVETRYKPNTAAIEKFAKEHGGLPDGIIAPERTHSLRPYFKKDKGGEK